MNTPQTNVQAKLSRVALEQFYDYTFNPITVAKGTLAQPGNGSYTLQFQNDAPFMVYAITGQIVDQASLAFIANANSTATLQIYDTGAGNNWFNIPSPWAGLVGVAGFEFSLPVQRVVAQSATLNLTVYNLVDGTTATGAVYTLTLIGTKIKIGTAG